MGKYVLKTNKTVGLLCVVFCLIVVVKWFILGYLLGSKKACCPEPEEWV